MLSDEQAAQEMAKMLDIPIENLKQSQKFFREGNIQGGFMHFALAKGFMDNLTEDENSKPPAQDKGYSGGEDAVEYAKGLAAGVWKGIFGEDPRQYR